MSAISFSEEAAMWFGQVPEHWTTCKFKSLIAKSNGGEVIDRSHWHEGDELLFTCQRDPMPSRFPGFPNHKRTKDNDLLVTRNGTPYVHLPPEGAIYSNVVQRCSLKEGVFRRFVAQSLAVACETLNGEGYGVSIASFSFPKWCNLSLPVPPPDEQYRIVAYLDEQTGKIDRLMDMRRRQMALLKEQRAALIQQAVTRGLNPNAPMKGSGLPWLGEIPAHWKVAVLKWQMQIASGDSVLTEALLIEPDGISNVPAIGGNGVMGFTAKSNVSSPILAIGRVGALCGNVHLVPPPAWITDNALMVFDVRGYSLEFLWRLLTVLNMNRLANHNAQPLITGTLVKNQRAPLPPLEEQYEILEFIQVKSAKFDALHVAYARQLTLLAEYRAALIHECVTGQRTLRQAQGEREPEADYA